MTIINYLNYKNPITKQKGVFTREALQKMSSKRFEICESAIMMQLKQIGIPRECDLGLCLIPNENKPKIYYDSERVYSDIIGFEWIALQGACVECEKMHGTIFGKLQHIPDKPHLNCRCIVYALYS